MGLACEQLIILHVRIISRRGDAERLQLKMHNGSAPLRKCNKQLPNLFFVVREMSSTRYYMIIVEHLQLNNATLHNGMDN